MNSTQRILKTTGKPETLLMSLAVVVAGTACARLRGEMEILQASICLLYAFATQLLANFTIAYSDITHGDITHFDERFYGDSTVKTLTGMACIATLIISLMLGLVVEVGSGPWAFIPGAVIYLCIYASTMMPIPLKKTPFGMLLPFLLFGLIGVGGSAQVELYYDNPDPFAWYYMSSYIFTGTAMGFLSVPIYMCGNLRFMKNDKENMRITFPVKFGKKATFRAIFISGLCFYALIEVFVFTQHVRRPWIATAVFSLPLIFNTWITVRLSKGWNLKIRPGYMAMLNYLLVAVLMMVYALIFGDSDRSRIMYIMGF